MFNEWNVFYALFVRKIFSQVRLEKLQGEISNLGIGKA